ncbi:MAG: hypothetical protein FWE31_05915 [Firmicutes bacterium]|nr:hypothetical protein [Bacillota bacterium]
MMCQLCKVKPAQILKAGTPVCVGCVSKVGRPTSFTITTTTTTFNFGDQVMQKSVVCTTCGKAFRDYEKTGRLGCSDCYKIFQKQLDVVIRRIHG